MRIPRGRKNYLLFLVVISVVNMLSNVIRLSSKTLKTQAVVPVRTIMTCTNHNAFTAQKTPYSPLIYEQKRTFLGPLMRYATQFLASLGGTSIRAFFQAFQQAAGIDLMIWIDRSAS